MRLVAAPAANGAPVDRLADLGRARGPYRPVGFVERQAALVPRQATMLDDAARLFFEIGDHVFITHIEDAARRKHAVPMLHQPLIAFVIAAEFGEIVGMVLLGGEQLRVAGNAGVDRIAGGMDDLRIRQRKANQAGEVIIRGHFIGNALAGRRESAHRRDIAGTDLPQCRRVECRDEDRIGNRVAVRSADGEDDVVEGLQLAGAVHHWMAGDDLLDQGGSRARHAEHEDRHARRIAAAGFLRDHFAREDGFDLVEQRKS